MHGYSCKRASPNCRSMHGANGQTRSRGIFFSRTQADMINRVVTRRVRPSGYCSSAVYGSRQRLNAIYRVELLVDFHHENAPSAIPACPARFGSGLSPFLLFLHGSTKAVLCMYIYIYIYILQGSILYYTPARDRDNI